MDADELAIQRLLTQQGRGNGVERGAMLQEQGPRPFVHAGAHDFINDTPIDAVRQPPPAPAAGPSGSRHQSSTARSS